LVGWL